MRLIDADKLKTDMVENIFNGDGVSKVFGFSAAQIAAAPTVSSTPPNDPLTLEELREMEEDPLRRINSSLRLQASEKERLAGGDPKSRYTREAAALWEASGLLKKLEADYEPLTLEELREMAGEPVWVQIIGYIGVHDGNYALVKGADGENIYMQSPDDPNDYGSIELYGEDWLAYRRKPEEGRSES